MEALCYYENFTWFSHLCQYLEITFWLLTGLPKTSLLCVLNLQALGYHDRDLSFCEHAVAVQKPSQPRCWWWLQVFGG